MKTFADEISLIPAYQHHHFDELQVRRGPERAVASSRNPQLECRNSFFVFKPLIELLRKFVPDIEADVSQQEARIAALESHVAKLLEAQSTPPAKAAEPVAKPAKKEATAKA